MMEGSVDTTRIERDLESTRARLDATIDALQQKLSPGQAVDQFITYLRDGGGAEFGRNLMRTVRDNPVPVALIGVGVAWLMVGSTRRHNGNGRDAGAYGTVGRAYPDVSEGMRGEPEGPYEAAAHQDMAAKAYAAGAELQRHPGETDESFAERTYSARGAALGVRRRAGETMSAFRERVDHAMHAAAEGFRHMREQAGALAARGQSGMQSLYGYAGNVRGRARDVGVRTYDYAHEHPFVMGAVGVGLGALLGMIMAPSQYERRLAGGMRHTMRDRARDMAQDVRERATRVVESVLDTAKESAEREGLTTEDAQRNVAEARDRVVDTAGKVRTVVEESMAAGHEALRREMGPGGEPAGSESTTQESRKAKQGRNTGSTEPQRTDLGSAGGTNLP